MDLDALNKVQNAQLIESKKAIQITKELTKVQKEQSETGTVLLSVVTIDCYFVNDILGEEVPIYEPVMLTFGGKAVRNVSTLNGTLFNDCSEES